MQESRVLSAQIDHIRFNRTRRPSRLISYGEEILGPFGEPHNPCIVAGSDKLVPKHPDKP